MGTKSVNICFNGTIESRDEAKYLLLNPGDFVIVKRGVPRYVILLCPCGCGDELIINLDKRSGPAWRLYEKSGCWSLYPSYWRKSGCNSHFILWSDRIYWCHKDNETHDDWEVEEEIENKVLNALHGERFTHYIELADECGLVAWECLQACNQLVEKRQCVANEGEFKIYFKKLNPKSNITSVDRSL